LGDGEWAATFVERFELFCERSVEREHDNAER
jgi:hypothetical protein